MIKLHGKNLTQFEVAEKLGISRGTLNRVLSGSPLVKPATRKRIEEALVSLGYSPNFMAQGLRTGRTKTIGLISLGSTKSSELEMTRAICEAAELQGYSVLLSYSDGTPEAEIRCLNELQRRRVDGLIIASHGTARHAPHFRQLVKNRVPMVVTPPVAGVAADYVHIDTRRAFARLTKLFIDAGHKSIGLLLVRDSQAFVVREREAGFRAAMKRAGLPVNEDFIIRASSQLEKDESLPVEAINLRTRSGYLVGFRGANAIFSMKRRPTAVLCQSDQAAIGFLHAARLAGVDVPGDIAITGYDDLHSSPYARVPVTTMHQPEAEYGITAVALLLRRIEGDWSDFPVTKALNTELIIRDSCGTAASA